MAEQIGQLPRSEPPPAARLAGGPSSEDRVDASRGRLSRLAGLSGVGPRGQSGRDVPGARPGRPIRRFSVWARRRWTRAIQLWNVTSPGGGGGPKDAEGSRRLGKGRDGD